MSYGYWLSLALILLIAESLGAAGFLLVLSIAAAVIGLLTCVIRLSLSLQLTLFAGLSMVMVLVYGLRKTPARQSTLNQPLHALIHQQAILVEALRDGQGRVRIRDSTWPVKGPDLPKGQIVRVVDVTEDAVLVVEPVDA